MDTFFFLWHFETMTFTDVEDWYAITYPTLPITGLTGYVFLWAYEFAACSLLMPDA